MKTITDYINNILACGAEKEGKYIMQGTILIRRYNLLEDYSELKIWKAINDIYYTYDGELTIEILLKYLTKC